MQILLVANCRAVLALYLWNNMEDDNKYCKPPSHVTEIASKLRSVYHDFLHYNKKRPLDNLLFIICSIKTDESKYMESYKRLRKRFPRLDMIASAPQSEIAETLSVGGLHNQKAKAIKGIVTKTIDHFGKASLSQLKKMPTSECEEFLTKLPHVGKKVARCVMMYPLGLPVFPVDTHVWRISCRLDWTNGKSPKKWCTSKDMDLLQESIPSELRFSLHVNMLSHGRAICAAQKPKCHICGIESLCAKKYLP